MDLLIIRHAHAGDKKRFASTGQPDSLRPLTREGEQKMAAAAKGLRAVIPSLDVIATSPYTRAFETARIVGKRYRMEPFIVAALASGQPAGGLLPWLKKQKGKTVAIVGHEPYLGTLIGWLTTGVLRKPFELRKAGACLLRFEKSVGPGKAELRWVMPPSLLAELG